MRFILTTLIAIFLAFTATAQSPIFEFECFSNANMTGDSCDICVGTSFQSRSFNGLMVYRLGVFNRWIDEPYLIRLRPGNSVEFIEQIGTNPDRITIPLNQTGFSTIGGLIDSTFCAGANVDFSFFASDSLRTTAINYLDTIKIVGRGGTTVFFDTLTQKYIIASPSSSGGTNLSFTGTSSPVTLNSSTGTDVNFVAGTSISLAATGTDLTITNTAPNINQTISTTGAAGNITLSDGGGTLNLNVNDADANPNNEIQSLSYSAPNLSLSGGGGSVAIPQGDITGSGGATQLSFFTGTKVISSSSTLVYDNINKILDFDAPTTIRFNQPQVGRAFMQFRSADASRYWRIFEPDASDKLIFCPEGNDFSIFSTNIYFQPTANLLTDGANTLNIGKIGSGTYLSTTAPSVIVGRERTQTSDYYTRAIQGNNYEWYTPTFNLGMRMFSDAANNLFTMRGSNIGVNEQNPQRPLHVAGIARITGTGLTATTLTGRDANNDITNVGIGTNLSISGGTLNAIAPTNAWIYDGNTIGSTKRIGSNDAFAVAIETNNTDRMYFDNAGKIGVGNTAPEVTMDFDGTTDGIVLPSGSAAQRPTILGNFVTRNLRYLGAFGLEISDNSNRYHLLSSGTTPSYVVGAAAGTGGGAAAGTGGNELSSLVTMTIGSAPSAGGVIFTRTFASVMTHAPTVVFSAGNSLTASEITKFYALATTSGYTLYSNATLQIGTNNYVLNIQVRN